MHEKFLKADLFFPYVSTPSGATRCQAKFLTCEISDFASFAHAQSNILPTKYADKTDY